MGDGKTVRNLFDDDVRFAVCLVGHEVRNSKHSDKRHGEARGVGPAEQFLGVGSRLVAVTGEEGIGIAFKRGSRSRPPLCLHANRRSVW